MPKSIFSYIFKYSKKWQLYLLAGTLIYLPILYLSFELPKIIVNDALDADPTSFPKVLLGFELSQVSYLLVLCFTLLALVITTGAARYVLSFYKGVLGEVMLRRLRYDLYTHILRFPLSHMNKVQSGEAVTMATSEVEPLGRYMGVAVANPVLQGGTLITAMVFLFAQDILLGFAAIALFPVQAYLVPKLQQRMNALSRQRLTNLRMFAGHVSETMGAKKEIHSHDTSAFELARVSLRLGILFRIRRSLYAIGNAITFLNNLFTQLTPFLFYAIGGYLVVKGELSLGALVAVIAAYREAAGPWNELLENYQSLEDNRVKYAALIESFLPSGLRELRDPNKSLENQPLLEFKGSIEAENLSVKDGDMTLFKGVTMTMDMPGKMALLGGTGSGHSQLAEVMAGLRQPTSGTYRIAGRDISDLTEDELGRTIAYADAESYVFTGNWGENFTYGLMRSPVMDKFFSSMTETQRAAWKREANAAGNVAFDPESDWIDYTAAGCRDFKELEGRVLETARLVELDKDLYDVGLNSCFNPNDRPDLAEKLLVARVRFKELLETTDSWSCLQTLDKNYFNPLTSYADNLLFGWWEGDLLSPEQIGANPYILELLERHNLLNTMLKMGHEMSQKMVNLFRDLPPGDERLQRFSIIDADHMPAYVSLLQRVPVLDEPCALSSEDRRLLMCVTMLTNPARHRVEVPEGDFSENIVAARREIMESLPEQYKDSVIFYDAGAINRGLTVRLNIFFGRIEGLSQQQRDNIESVLTQVIEELSLQDTVMTLGLGESVGTRGAKLTRPQRQKIAVARCLLKRPQILIMNEALWSVEAEAVDRILNQITRSIPDTSVVWVDRDRNDLDDFDVTMRMKDGRPVDIAGKAHVSDVEDTPGIIDAVAQDIQILSRVPILMGIDRKALELIVLTADEVTFEESQIIFEEGGETRAAYIVMEGEVIISGGSGDESDQFGSFRQGTTVGEISLLADCNYVGTATAISQVRALRLERDIFSDLLRNNPDLALAILKSVSGRMAGTLRHLSDLQTSGVIGDFKW